MMGDARRTAISYAKRISATMVAVILCLAVWFLMCNIAMNGSMTMIDEGVPLQSPEMATVSDVPSDEPATELETIGEGAAAVEGESATGYIKSPTGMPAAIRESDGTLYNKVGERVSEDGSVAYVYESAENVEFDDGGLGSAELVIN